MHFPRRSIPVLIFALLGTASFWALYRFGATQTWELYRVLLVLLLAALVVALTVEGAPARGVSAVIFLLVGAALLIQTVLRPTLEGQGYALAAVGWLAVFLARAVARRGTSWARTLFWFLIVLGGLEALYGILQATAGVGHVAGDLPGKSNLARGSLINPSHFAGLVNMTILLTVGGIAAALSPRGREPRSERLAKGWMLILLGATMGLSVLLSRSRGGVLTLLVSLVVVSILLTVRRRLSRSTVQTPGSTLVWILLLTVLALGSVTGFNPLATELKQTVSAKGRLQVYRDTLDLVADHPVAGAGPGLYNWRFRPYQSLRLDTRYYHAHNDYLETAAEWGIPLALVIWCFVLRRWYGATRVFLEARHPWRRGLALGASGAIGAILLHSLIDFNLQIPSNLLVFGMILGLAWGLERGQDRPAARGESALTKGGAGLLRIGLRVAVVVLLLGAGWRVTHQYLALEASRHATGISDLERAMARDPTAPEPHFRLGLLLRDSPQSRDLAAAQGLLQRAVELNPHSWRYWWELSRLHEALEQPEAARRALLEAVRRNPRQGTYRFRLGNFYLRRGRLDLALQELKLAVAQDPSLLPASVPLLVKAGASPDQIEDIWPQDLDSHHALANLKSQTGARFGGKDEASTERDEAHPPAGSDPSGTVTKQGARGGKEQQTKEQAGSRQRVPGRPGAGPRRPE